MTERASRQSKKYRKETRVITTVQRGAKHHENFFKNLENLKKKERAKKIELFVTQGTHKNKLGDELLDDFFKDEKKFELINGDNPLRKTTIKTAETLNQNVLAYYTKVLPQNVNPGYGYKSKLPAYYSYVINGTKVRFEMLPQSRFSPHFMMSTGAGTLPKYREQFAVGEKAREQHQYGAAILEIINDKKFVPYSVIANGEGNFSHKGFRYRDGKVEKVRAAAMVLGDIHLAVSDKDAIKETFQQAKLYNPKNFFLHDVFDGLSINHHDKKEINRRSHLFHDGKLDVKKEVEDAYKFLTKFSKKFPKSNIFVVSDNHSQNIIKYIEDKRYVEDVWNYKYGTSLAYIFANHRDLHPLYAAIKALSLNKEKTLPKNIKFLSKDAKKSVWGYLLSDHGHIGINGARGSWASYDKNNIKAILGHSHTPRVGANTMSVGHLSKIAEQDYAKGGLSTWLQANMVVNTDGTSSMLVLKNNFGI